MVDNTTEGGNGHAGSAIDPHIVARHILPSFFRLCEAWKLGDRTQADILGLADPEELRRWRSSGLYPKLDRTITARVADIFVMYRALFMLLQDHDRVCGWMAAANSAPGFEGRSGAEIITSGNWTDIRMMRDYLIAQTGGL